MNENIQRLQEATQGHQSALNSGKRRPAKNQIQNRLITDKEKKLVQGMLSGKSITKSALEAGYTMSMAEAHCCRWFTEEREDSLKPNLWDYWQAKRAVMLRKWEVNTDNVMNELQMIASSNIANFVELHSTEEIEGSDDPEKVFMRLAGRTLRVKSFKEIPQELMPCIESISEDKHGVKIKLYNKLAAIDMLCKIQGIYKQEKPASEDSDKPLFGELNLVVNGTRSPLISQAPKINPPDVQDVTSEPVENSQKK